MHFSGVTGSKVCGWLHQLCLASPLLTCASFFTPRVHNPVHSNCWWCFLFAHRGHWLSLGTDYMWPSMIWTGSGDRQHRPTLACPSHETCWLPAGPSAHTAPAFTAKGCWCLNYMVGRSVSCEIILYTSFY